MSKQLFLGCASNIIEVPLFAELIGYGRFLGRRNRGVHAPLYCRAASFYDGRNRLIIISNDLCLIDAESARKIRSEVAKKLDIDPSGIMISASHTHSGPAMDVVVGWGEVHCECRESWRKLAVETALQAAADEAPVKSFSGASRLKEKLGVNRVSEKNGTDPEIRWLKFVSEDGVVKLLIHNHGMHGVLFGASMLQVSPDWCGTANSRILEKGLAENVLFLQGACGDINTEPVCMNFEEGKPHLERIAESYSDSLAGGLGNAREINLLPLKAALKASALPCIEMTSQEYREAAAKLGEGREYDKNRLEELALLLEAGEKLSVTADLQVFRMGDAFVYALPGEVFYELGLDIVKNSAGKFSMLSEVSNGSCGYFPTQKTFDDNPDFFAEKRGYGYYEVHFLGLALMQYNLSREIAPFLTDKMKELVDALD